MAKRTYNRQPKSVGMDYYEKQGLSDKYLNFNEFHGLNTNKNYLAIDQQSFADCDNVYVNQDKELSVRPPVKYKSISAIPASANVIDIIKIQNTLFYYTFLNNNYYLYFSKNGHDYTIQTVEKMYILWYQSWYLLFEDVVEDGKNIVKVRAFTLDNGEIKYYDTDKIIFVGSNDNDEKNVLTTSFKVSEIIDNNLQFPMHMIGKNITITIGDFTYTLTATNTTKYILVDALSKNSMDIDSKDYIKVSSSSSGTLYYLVVKRSTREAYVSFDGNIFINIFNAVIDKEADYFKYDLTKTMDGDTVRLWYVQMKYGTAPIVYYTDINFNNLPKSSTDWKSITIDSSVILDNSKKAEVLNGKLTSGYNYIRCSRIGTYSWEGVTKYLEMFPTCSHSRDEFILVVHMRAEFEITYTDAKDIIMHSSRNVSGTCIYNLKISDNNVVQTCAFVEESYIDMPSSAISIDYCSSYNENIDKIIQICWTSERGVGINTCYLCTMPNHEFFRCYIPEVSGIEIHDFEICYTFYSSYNNTTSSPVQKSLRTLTDRQITYSLYVDKPYNVGCYKLGNIMKSIVATSSSAISMRDSRDDILEQYGTLINVDWYASAPMLYEQIVHVEHYTEDYMLKRSLFPIVFIRNDTDLEPSGKGVQNFTTINTVEYNEDYFNHFVFNSDYSVLTDYYYYIEKEVVQLLHNDVLPIYVSDNSKITYYSFERKLIFTNTIFANKVYLSYVVSGNTNLFIPDFYIDGYKRAFAKDNQLYILSDADEKGMLYVKNVNVISFESNITALANLSSTSIAIFLEDCVHILFDNNGMNLIKSKLQLGNRKGNTAMNIYDGSSILLPTLNGLTSLSYEQFVQSTDQVYKYLSEQIMDNFDVYFEGNIKLKQYKRWIFMFRQDLHYFFLYDISANAWWKWTLPYPISNLEYDDENGLLLLLMNNKICNFDLLYKTFVDFVDSRIDWNIVTQKLHFNAPNNYKHIRAVNVITTQKGNKIRYKLKYKNYRNIDNTEEDDVREFTIENLTTTINRVAFIKTNAFQVELSNDKSDNNAVPFITPGISIKYRITEKIR